METRGHGRVENRTIQVFAIEPLASGLPHVRSLVVVTKRTRSTKRGGVKAAEEFVSHHLSSLVPQVDIKVRATGSRPLGRF